MGRVGAETSVTNCRCYKAYGMKTTDLAALRKPNPKAAVGISRNHLVESIALDNLGAEEWW